MGDLLDDYQLAGAYDETRRILGRCHAELSFLRVSDAAADLPELLEHLQDATVQVHGAVTGRYFLDTHAIAWSA